MAAAAGQGAHTHVPSSRNPAQNYSPDHTETAADSELLSRFFRSNATTCVWLVAQGGHAKLWPLFGFEPKLHCSPLLWPLMAKIMATNLMNKIWPMPKYLLGYCLAILDVNQIV
jgi:hypothetical protein